ncbi:MAG TPA: xanthine dehydrogenase family protein molybdopterin-binding subunit, partial [Methylomirabilota bacterium]|nr:xanthine dehydrogenase family protein molybdopterin-binding subunit [Methylomirabilota bacterium]
MAVGAGVRRRDGVDKVTGRALYVDDLAPPGVLHARTVRTAVPRGRLERIEFDPSLPWAEIIRVTARDIPGRNRILLVADDQPCLVESEIRHAQEPVALLAHPDPALLDRAVRGVRLVVTPAAPVLDLDAARETLAAKTLERGDVEAGLAQADLIVEGVYETGAQEHVYIEPQGMLVTPREDGGVLVQGSLQCPYYVQPAVAAVLGVPPERVRVVQTTTGGGFGGKEEYPSIVAAHAALLARASGRPVKLVYGRTEDMLATTKRHPSRVRHRLGVRRDGTFVALDTELVLDGGAYVTLSPVVLSRAVIHAPGPYRWPHARVRGRVMATSYPPHGAFRGFGAPQAVFALEVHVDRVAAALGLDPVELRRRNLLRPGDTTATGQALDPGVDTVAVLDAALEAADVPARRRACAAANAVSRHVKRGVGLAAFFHGSGFTGGGEVALDSVAGLRLLPGGEVQVLASSTEIGQGAATTHAQIVSETLGIPEAMVRPAPPDTAVVPNSGPTVASRTCMVVGGLLERAAREMLATLRARGGLPRPHDAAAFRAAARRWAEAHGPLETRARYAPPAGRRWDDARLAGDAYGAYAWACYVAEVEVDTRTGEATVTDFTAVQEVGRVINPVIARGQIEGGVAQGLGLALYEHVAWREGAMANPRLADYILPTSADTPPIRVVFLESPYADGPFGAKGLGELPI